MNTRLLALFVLVVGLGILPTLAQTIHPPGPSEALYPAGLSDTPGPRHATVSVPVSFFDVYVDVLPLSVEIVSLDLLGPGLGVGQNTTLTAQTCPPLSDTGGTLSWTVLSGMGTISGVGTGETVDGILTLAAKNWFHSEVRWFDPQNPADRRAILENVRQNISAALTS